MRGWQESYRDGIEQLGADFLDLGRRRAGRARRRAPELKHLLFEHTCQACYGAPEYGGNRDLTGGAPSTPATCNPAAAPTRR